MIAVDSSAVVAIALAERESGAFSKILADSDRNVMSAANDLECAMVLVGRFGSRSEFDDRIGQRHIEIASVDHALARLAADAFARFGKGRHPAGLNFAYALAKSLNASLLFKGHDFARTDVVPALP